MYELEQGYEIQTCHPGWMVWCWQVVKHGVELDSGYCYTKRAAIRSAYRAYKKRIGSPKSRYDPEWQSASPADIHFSFNTGNSPVPPG